MAQNATEAGAASSAHDETAGQHTHIDDEFFEVTMLLTFLLATWTLGKIVQKAKVPSLIGEIIVGMVLGPNLLDVVPFPEALGIVGEVGLLLLVLEAGLEVDLQMLKQIGGKGLAVAAVGSIVPLGMGTGIAVGIGKMEIMEALAVGACLAPTSMAIALNILKTGKALQTPSGQLIIAAAVIDDVIALVLLSELKALQETPAVLNFVTPIISSVLFVLGVGGCAIFAMPRLMKMEFVKKHMPVCISASFFAMFALSIGLMNATYYGQSSFLLGAFLAGLCFCTLPELKTLWHGQVKRIETWMLRLFFSTTIAFKVPVKDLWSPKVIALAFALLIPLLGKVITGVFGPRPVTKLDFFTIGFAMSAWGEFAFVVANTSLSLGIVSKDTFASIVLAVLISAILSPWALSYTLLLSRRQKENMQQKVMMSTRKKRGIRHAYLEVDICCINRWGLIDGLISKFHSQDLKVLDFTVSSVDKFSVMRLYVKNTSKELEATREDEYVRKITETIAKYCKISVASSESDFGFLPPSPIPSAVFRREDILVGVEEMDLYPCLSVKPWEVREGSREGQSVAKMQESLDNFSRRVNSARKLDQIQRSRSLAKLQTSIIRSAQS